MTLVFTIFVLSVGLGEDSPATPPIDGSGVTEWSFDPPTVELSHSRARPRFLLSGKFDGRLIDLTDSAQCSSSDEAVFTINHVNEIVPEGDGSAELIATIGSHSLKMPVVVKSSQTDLPVSFVGEIEPIMSKLSCNSGGCHGKSGGQNGFRLSLLAYDPKLDYDTMVIEGRGRRVSPEMPGQSLLLRKAIGELPHGGGKKMTAGDSNYERIVHWIRQGMPYSETDPVVTKIEIAPQGRVMATKARQRLRVTATYSDGRLEDVTRQVQFQSNDESVATVTEDALVTTHEQTGEAAIMARYMGQVSVFRASVPIRKPGPGQTDFVVSNEIDNLTNRKWADLGLVPSRRSTDPEFIRRVTIDLCGRLPSVEELVRFVTSTEPNKRELLVDRLLASEDFAAHMAMKWGAVLQNKRSGRGDYASGTHALSLWLKEAFSQDMPYDQFVRSILTATGTPTANPPVVWYRQVRTPEQNVDNVTQLFLGTRIQCAQCHHHPFEKWSREDYYSFAAFFARVGRKPFETSENGEATEALFVSRTGSVTSPVTKAEAKPAGLDGPKLDIPAGIDPREKLADWMTDPANPFFARALVNRVWGHFFGRGIVEPIDDMRVTNPPTNPELLDWLAGDFVSNGYRLKRLMKTIALSSTYQLASEPNEWNKADGQNFARYYPKRLPAEVLLDSIDEVTQVKTNFSYPEEMTAVDLPDEGIASYFLDIFGRPQRQSSCDCERTDDANLSQALHLLNSQEIQGKLTSETSRASKLAADARPIEEKVRELYLSFFSRQPTSEEAKVAVQYIDSAPDKKVAFQNLLWALLNTKEFQFNI